jgi:hypothetical protein
MKQRGRAAAYGDNAINLVASTSAWFPLLTFARRGELLHRVVFAKRGVIASVAARKTHSYHHNFRHGTG